MKIAPATAFAAWAVGTAWLILFVILEHFDHPGPDFIDYLQWGSVALPLLFFPLIRKWFTVWLDKLKRP